MKALIFALATSFAAVAFGAPQNHFNIQDPVDHIAKQTGQTKCFLDNNTNPAFSNNVVCIKDGSTRWYRSDDGSMRCEADVLKYKYSFNTIDNRHYAKLSYKPVKTWESVDSIFCAPSDPVTCQGCSDKQPPRVDCNRNYEFCEPRRF